MGRQRRRAAHLGVMTDTNAQMQRCGDVDCEDLGVRVPADHTHRPYTGATTGSEA